MQLAYTIAFTLSGTVSAAIALASWRRRPAPGASGLALLCLGQALWSGIFALQLLLTGGEPSLWWLFLRVSALQFTPTAILVFVVQFIGRDRWLTRRNVALLLVQPVFVLLAVATDPWHGQYLAGRAPELYLTGGGPLFWFNLVYSYALIIIAAALMARRMFRGPYRVQAGVVFVAVALPVIHFLAQTLFGFAPLPGINSVPLSFTITGVLKWLALTRLGLFRLIPVARDQLIEQLPVGVVVFDRERRIIDVNPAALRMTGATGPSVGRTADEAFPQQAETIAALRKGLSASETAVATAEFAPGLHIEATATVLLSRPGERIATLVTLRDVTAEVNAAREIAARGDRLEAAYERTGRILAAMTEGVMLVDADGALLHANAALDDMLGQPTEQYVGEPAAGLVPGLAVETLARDAERSISPVSSEVRSPDGRAFAVEAIPLREAASDGAATLFVIRDETERRAAERMQRDFVANVAHELQTPLTGLSLLAETLPRAMRTDPGSVDGFITRLGVEVARLVHLTGELLALSKADSPPSESLGPVDVASIIEDELVIFHELAGEKDQRIDVAVTSGLRARCEASDVHTIVSNLLLNAMRYSDEEGRISVSAALTVGPDGTPWVAISVTDDGIGIPPADQIRIFERFYRVDKARSRRTGGTGLGLSIVKATAERCGGSVSVVSAPGEGSTFTVLLRPA